MNFLSLEFFQLVWQPMVVGGLCGVSLVPLFLIRRFVVGGVGELPASLAWIAKVLWIAFAAAALGAIAYMVSWVSAQSATGLAEAIALIVGFLCAMWIGWIVGTSAVDGLRAKHALSAD